MIASTLDYLLTLQLTGLWGILLYWCPLAFCIFGYTLRTHENLRKDLAARRDKKLYYPTDTIGTLLGRALVSILPVANLWAAVFDLAPRIFSRFFAWVERIFDTPLVPKRKDSP